MGLTQTIPIFTSFGPSIPDPSIHREIHKTFYTEDYFCFRVLPDQALQGLPRRQELQSHYLPSLFSTSLLWSSLAPFHPRTKPLGDLGLGVGREEEEDGGKRHSHGLLLWRPAQLGPGAAVLPHLNCRPF